MISSLLKYVLDTEILIEVLSERLRGTEKEREIYLHFLIFLHGTHIISILLGEKLLLNYVLEADKGGIHKP